MDLINLLTRHEMKFVKRILNYYGMPYIKQGSALVRMHGREYVTKLGVVTIFPPGIPHDHIIITEEPRSSCGGILNLKLPMPSMS